MTYKKSILDLMQFDEQLSSLAVKARHLADIMKAKVDDNLTKIESYIKNLEKQFGKRPKQKLPQAPKAVKVHHVKAVRSIQAIEIPLMPINLVSNPVPHTHNKAKISKLHAKIHNKKRKYYK